MGADRAVERSGEGAEGADRAVERGEGAEGADRAVERGEGAEGGKRHDGESRAIEREQRASGPSRGKRRRTRPDVGPRARGQRGLRDEISRGVQSSIWGVEAPIQISPRSSSVAAKTRNAVPNAPLQSSNAPSDSRKSVKSWRKYDKRSPPLNRMARSSW